MSYLFQVAHNPLYTITGFYGFASCPIISFAKALNVSSSLFSAFSTRLKKQLGTSFNFKFLLIHGAHPLSCFVGCSGQLKFLQVQNWLILLICFFTLCLIRLIYQIQTPHILQLHNPVLLFLRRHQFRPQFFH